MNKKNLLLGIIILIVTFIIIISTFEIYLRVQYSREHDLLVAKYEIRQKSRELCTHSSDDPRLIYSYTPNNCNANSQGYQDDEHNFSKEQDVYRIVLIGDSIAKGQGVKLNESFGKVLEKRLNEQNQTSELIILATSGYSTSQELVLLEEQAFLYDPDLIIWSYVLNDPGHPLYHEVNGELGKYFFKPKFHIWHYISKKLFLINEKKKGAKCVKEFHKFLHCVYKDEIKENIEKISILSEEKDVPVIFLIHPVLMYAYNNGNYYYPFVSEHSDLKLWASNESLIVLDLLDIYSQYDFTQLKLNSDDPWHPNVLGHEIIGNYIYTFLQENNFS